MALILGGFV